LIIIDLVLVLVLGLEGLVLVLGCLVLVLEGQVLVNITALNPARVSGERVSSPSEVWGGAPAKIEFGAF